METLTPASPSAEHATTPQAEMLTGTPDSVPTAELVDIEEDNQDELMNDPFNPEEISIDSKVVSMDQCLRRLTQGTIKLNPDFQREEVWTIEKKSQLIESLMLKIPLPMFYVSADEKSNFTVVDGLQRLSTIRSFILGDKYLDKREERYKGEGFKLKDLEFWKIYEGMCFNELPPFIQNRILESEFQFTVINPGTPEEVRRNIFKRLNTGGMPLSSQEIRNALYMGQSTILLRELAGYAEFRDATGGSIKSQRMEDKELILRMLAFLIRDYKTYTRTLNVDTLLSDTMIIINAMPEMKTRELHKGVLAGNINLDDVQISNLDQIRNLFKIGMKRSRALFGRHTFRKSFGNDYRSSINKSLFEMWGTLLAKLPEDAYERLLANQDALLADYVLLIRPVELNVSREEALEILNRRYAFEIAISRDSMKHTAVKFRFDSIQALINKHSQ